MPRVLLIDNYDSFTHNLAQAMLSLGAEVIVRRNDEISVEEARDLAPTHLVISPGPGAPDESGISRDLIRNFAAAAAPIPILGVCLGHQAIGQIFGGRIIRAPRLMHGKSSLVHHNGSGLYGGLPSPFQAGRYHSLALDEASLPAVLEVTCRSEHGEIMGIRHRELDVEGVQFHPESVLTPLGEKLIANFLNRTSALSGQGARP
jgi:anthranilate synthase/aminodeoxychorismate synthase-like glutamine amidotransferase